MTAMLPAAGRTAPRARKLAAIALLSVLLAACGRASAATYYVDFAGGSDTAAGTSATTAWKHAPGDREASGRAGGAELRAGDTVRFRGGVAYRGTIRMPASGSAAAPIRYVGDEWGTAPAIFDGSDAVATVERCPDAVRCGNATNWAQLSLISFKPPSTALVKFFDDTGILYQGQYPAPPDPFFSDDINSYAKFPVSAGARVRGGELEWPEAAKRLAGNAEGTELSIWVQANQVVRRTLVGARGNVLVFIPGDVNPYTDRDGRYAIVGSPMLLDAAGQKALLESADGIFIGGGETFVLLGELYRTGQLELIRQRVAAGVPYGGSSAGANVAGLLIGTTNDFPVAEIPSRKALGIFPAVINPHHPTPETKPEFDGRAGKIKIYLQFNPAENVLGIAEKSAVRLHDGRVTLECGQAWLYRTDGVRALAVGEPVPELAAPKS